METRGSRPHGGVRSVAITGGHTHPCAWGFSVLSRSPQPVCTRASHRRGVARGYPKAPTSIARLGASVLNCHSLIDSCLRSRRPQLAIEAPILYGSIPRLGWGRCRATRRKLERRKPLGSPPVDPTCIHRHGAIRKQRGARSPTCRSRCGDLAGKQKTAPSASGWNWTRYTLHRPEQASGCGQSGRAPFLVYAHGT